jgi:hypothetical protein
MIRHDPKTRAANYRLDFKVPRLLNDLIFKKILDYQMTQISSYQRPDYKVERAS